MSLLCIDIGGTSLKFALCHNGQLSQQSSFPLPLVWKSFTNYSTKKLLVTLLTISQVLPSVHLGQSIKKRGLSKAPALFPTFTILKYKRP